MLTGLFNLLCYHQYASLENLHSLAAAEQCELSHSLLRSNVSCSTPIKLELRSHLRNCFCISRLFSTAVFYSFCFKRAPYDAFFLFVYYLEKVIHSLVYIAVFSFNFIRFKQVIYEATPFGVWVHNELLPAGYGEGEGRGVGWSPKKVFLIATLFTFGYKYSKLPFCATEVSVKT